jgi:dTDP-4-dehydrorhamnose reductase
MVRSLAREGEFNHPLLERPGWWKKSELQAHGVRPVLITGGHGTLGRAFARLCVERDIPCVSLTRQEFDIADPEQVASILKSMQPWAVVNAAGYVHLDAAETDRERCFRANVMGPALLAENCKRLGIRFLSFSTDMVFDGRLNAYHESCAVRPLNVYGESKAESERMILSANPEAMIVRTSSFFGPWDPYNFVTQTLRRVVRQEPVHALSDVRVSPTYVPDLVHTALDLLIDGEQGIVHLANRGEVTWSDWARSVVRVAAKGPLGARADEALVVDKNLADFGLRAARPRNSVLTSERVKLMPQLDDALARYMKQVDFKAVQTGVLL